MRTNLALASLALATGGLVATGCVDDSPSPTIATGSLWIAPLPQQIALDWQGPQTCTQVLDCDAPPVAFTIDSVTCDNCTVASAGVGDGTAYPGGSATLTALATGAGPIAITAVLRDTNGNTSTVKTTTVGDIATGISATCEDYFLDGTTAFADNCTIAGRSSINSLTITPSFTTTAHGSFPLGAFSNTAEQLDTDVGAGAADLARSAFPTVSPGFVAWSTDGSAYVAEMDPTTAATSIALLWTVGGNNLSTTVTLPPLAP